MSAPRAGRTARARAQELDPAAAVKRARKKISERNVSLRPAPDGMAILSALLPQKEGVAAYAALHREARARKGQGDSRGKGQIMADTLVERTTGAATVDDIPVEIQLLMTDKALLDGGDEAAWLNDHPVPAAIARDIALGVRGTNIEGSSTGSEEQLSAPEISKARRWIRRLYSDSPSTELDAVDSRRRLFTGHVRRFVLLRDQRCRTPWCDAPIRDIDHVHRSADGGVTTADNGVGHCQQFNLARETPGWHSRIVPADGAEPSTLIITTPTGHTYSSPAPRLRPPRQDASATPDSDPNDPAPPNPTPPKRSPQKPTPPGIEPPERDLMIRRPLFEGSDDLLSSTENITGGMDETPQATLRARRTARKRPTRRTRAAPESRAASG